MAIAASDTLLVCTPGAIAPAARAAHRQLTERIFGDLVVAQEDLPDGYRFAFHPDAFESLARFVENERRCCPAIHFEITVSPGGGPVLLALTGPENIREFLRAELPISG